MSTTDDRPSPHEVVIVRRRPSGDHDGHHGGAWKIAFADFMTALMCFFLVMWLVNASDKQTITQIATYFNPIRLNDRLNSQKGLNDPDGKPPAISKNEKGKPKPPAGAADAVQTPGKGAASEPASQRGRVDPALMSEIDLLQNPFEVLNQISAELNADRILAAPAKAKAGMPRDMFDSQTPASTADRVNNRAPAGGAVKAPSSPGPAELSAERIKSEIAAALAALPANPRPRVEVTDNGREVLISISDDSEQGMFAVGSSRPTAVLVHVMEAVARSLNQGSGAIVVRGHTDGRPYLSGAFDNWRLSTARAQISYYMLVRSGIPAARIRRIEGHADRQLSVPADPLAPQNRRIEVLVAKGKS